MNKQRDIRWYSNRVKMLRSKPQPEQRSEKWFKARQTRVTASEAACCLTLSEEICKQYVEDFNVKNFKYKPDKCLSHYDNREDYIINKCRTFYGENLFKDSIYTLHGKKYEEVATRLYRRKFNTDVIEFGLLPHPRLNYLAASPDGITPNGVMLEIKCPYSRKIEEGIPPIWYWCQMMIQLEVADLDQCDFLECEIKELNNEQQFIEQAVGEKQDKGILLNKVNESNNSETKYIYPPDNLNTVDDFINWSNITIQEYKLQNIQVLPLYYFINKWFVINIYRRKEWFDNIKHYFKETMTLIKKLQDDPLLFKDYRDSIYKLRNKEYLERYNNTVCLIEQDYDYEDEFVIRRNSYTEIETEIETDNMNIDIPEKQLNNINNLCLISDT
jgi:hypothetical protein